MSKITITKGTEVISFDVNNKCTAADLAGDSMLRTIFNLGDQVQIIRNGVELPATAPIKNGDKVEVVKAANDKGASA